MSWGEDERNEVNRFTCAICEDSYSTSSYFRGGVRVCSWCHTVFKGREIKKLLKLSVRKRKDLCKERIGVYWDNEAKKEAKKYGEKIIIYTLRQEYKGQGEMEHKKELISLKELKNKLSAL